MFAELARGGVLHEAVKGLRSPGRPPCPYRGSNAVSDVPRVIFHRPMSAFLLFCLHASLVLR